MRPDLPGQRIGRPRSPTGNTARVLAQLSTSEWRTAAFVAAASAVPAPNVHDRLRALHGFGEVERRSVPWVGYQWRLVAIGRCAFCGDPVAMPEGRVIAALFVQTGGVYFGLPDVDPWDEARDARLYAGPWPVVAHPPCSRWCRLAGLAPDRRRLGQRGLARRLGLLADNASTALVSWCGNHVASGETRPRVGKAVASRSPLAFRDALLDMARSVRRAA